MGVIVEIDEVPFGTVPPIQVVESVLPDGAATEVTLAAVNTKLGAALPLPSGAASEVTLAAVNTKLGAALPLPTGAASAALQTTGNGSLSSIDGKVQAGVTAITHYNIIINTADTEYSQALPANTKILSFRTRELVDIRYAFVTGKVDGPTDPYMTLRAGEIFSERNLNLTGKTLYVGSDIGAIHVEVEAGS